MTEITSMQPIQGTAYAPGQARGRICRETTAVDADCLMLLAADQLKIFEQAQAESKKQAAGLIIIGAMPLSHAMIRLLGLGVPIVVITATQAELLPRGEEVVIDGSSGAITTAAATTLPPLPSPPQVGTPILTADGELVSLRTSLADAESATLACTNGATAIGLVRSECLTYRGKLPPDAEFYYAALKKICIAAQPLAVTIRLLDIAPDKLPTWLPAIKGTDKPLGLQGVRLYDIQSIRKVVDAELEAISRLANEFSLSLLLPYLTYPEEFLHWRNELGQSLPTSVTIGAMAETPAAVLAIDELLRHTELVAFGCNDLMQCLCAANRIQPELGAYLRPYAPSLFRFLDQAAQIAKEHIHRIQLCGLLSQMPGIMPVMLGLGYRAFSVEVHLIPYLADVVRTTDTQAAAELAIAVCASTDSAAVRSLLKLPPRAAWAMA